MCGPGLEVGLSSFEALLLAASYASLQKRDERRIEQTGKRNELQVILQMNIPFFEYLLTRYNIANQARNLTKSIVALSSRG